LSINEGDKMSDLIRDFIKVWSPDKHRDELLAALDAERTKHEKEVADLKLQLEELKNNFYCIPKSIYQLPSSIQLLKIVPNTKMS
jgi:hypothetical protein